MSAPRYAWTVMPPQRVCGWCAIELAPGTLPATRGICPGCYVTLERELDPTPKGGA